MQLSNRPYILVILDGWGCTDNPLSNAIQSAKKPVWDKIWKNYPHTLVNASGMDVGLPDDQMGNSEVGHMNIGSGRIVNQEFTRIKKAIDDGEFFQNPTLVNAFRKVAGKQKALHILGLLSDGGVHSHQDHVFALLDLAARSGIEKIYLHAFLDGRDTPPKSALGYLQATQLYMNKLGRGRFASITGRYFAMDRNKSWDRTRIAYDLIMNGKSRHRTTDAIMAVEQSYARGETDEFVKPTAIVPEGENPVQVNDGDVIIFANFRSDRARQLSQAFTDLEFSHFTRTRKFDSQSFISMTQYKADFTFLVAFPPEQLNNSLGEYISDLGLKQLRIAETEKYAHVTFFFNGGEERVFINEYRILVPSPKVATYDLKPEMSAPEVTDKLVEAIKSGKYDVIICNYANADMVGHTGIFDAAVKAIETIDHCLGRIIEAASSKGGEVMITADHGNAEQMESYTSENNVTQAHTAHTTNLVPFIYIGRSAKAVPGTGALCDIAPSLLHIMGIKQPREMTGRVLFELQEPSKRTVANS